MQAVREIKTVSSRNVVVKVPKSFLNRKIEILLLPVEDTLSEAKVRKGAGCLESLSWAMGGRLYKDRDELYERR